MAGRLLQIAQLARKVVAAGPFYAGIDDGFCAVCNAYFTIGEDHKADCAYVALRALFGMENP